VSWVWGAFGFAVLGLFWFVLGLASKSGRIRSLEDELEDWEGVIDVKREVDDRLNNPNERKRVRDKYNKSNPDE
jgi:hypothetical protein